MKMSVILWKKINVCYSVEISVSTKLKNLGFE
jgi:hypothetical protein